MLAYLFAIVIPFPLCAFRRKKYDISFGRMLLIYFVFSSTGVIGAGLGSLAIGGNILGMRLYGLMILDTVTLFVMSRLLKIGSNALGDFVAVPIMAVCASSKIACIVNHCCNGMVLCYSKEQLPVRFPSAIVEMVIWGIFVGLLLLLEKRGRSVGMLWPVGMIWFGAMRYAVDFLRNTSSQLAIYPDFMTGSQFWSLVAAVIGMVHLFFVLKRKIGRNPKIGEVIRCVFGANGKADVT